MPAWMQGLLSKMAQTKKENMKRYLARLRNRLLPRYIIELLKPVNVDPPVWDIASIQLQRLGNHVRQVGYPQYLYGLLSAVRTARAVGKKKITAIEFGVAGSNGLVAMEKHAKEVDKQYDVSIDIVGFDTSSGIPHPSDPRDCPYAFRGGEFPMDVEKVKSRLNTASLRIGGVKDTIRSFMDEDFAPVGFVSNDFDLYSSTRDSLDLFFTEADRLLPRVSMYFDDLIGYPYTTIAAEWAAIKEFNAISPDRQIAQIYGLKHHVGRKYRFDKWPEMFFVLHVHDHDAYNKPEEMPLPDLSLR
jgi:hypothetical protein